MWASEQIRFQQREQENIDVQTEDLCAKAKRKEKHKAQVTGRGIVVGENLELMEERDQGQVLKRRKSTNKKLGHHFIYLTF